MNEELKETIEGFYRMADKMSAAGYPGSSMELKDHMMLVSVAIAAANGGITEREMQCIDDYLGYTLDIGTVNKNILPEKLENILREPPTELFSFVEAEEGAGERFVQAVEKYLDVLIGADGDVNDNEVWVKDVYVDMLKDALSNARSACRQEQTPQTDSRLTGR